MFDREIQDWIALVEKLNSVQRGEGMDRIQWTLKGSGSYSSKSMFYHLNDRQSIANSTLTSLIWKGKCPKKVKVFLWSLAYRSLNTDEKLQEKFWRWTMSPSSCRLYLKNEENLDHLFLHYEFAHQSWGWIARKVGIQFCLP